VGSSCLAACWLSRGACVWNGHAAWCVNSLTTTPALASVRRARPRLRVATFTGTSFVFLRAAARAIQLVCSVWERGGRGARTTSASIAGAWHMGYVAANHPADCVLARVYTDTRGRAASTGSLCARARTPHAAACVWRRSPHDTVTTAACLVWPCHWLLRRLPRPPPTFARSFSNARDLQHREQVSVRQLLRLALQAGAPLLSVFQLLRHALLSARRRACSSFKR
jgi:hypothetical protein